MASSGGLGQENEEREGTLSIITRLFRALTTGDVAGILSRIGRLFWASTTVEFLKATLSLLYIYRETTIPNPVALGDTLRYYRRRFKFRKFVKMEESNEEFEPLFDYSRVQPIDLVASDDDDCSDSSPPKRKKVSNPAVEKEAKTCNAVDVIDCEEDEEDWLAPPPKVSDVARKFEQDSTIMELRLKKQELASFAQSAEKVLREVEESAKREHSSSLQSSLESQADQPSKPHDQRVKIIISIQDKDGLKQFRMFMDDKFERLFKMYAEKVERDLESLVFSFDGDKVSAAATPDGLGMEDNDIIEVHIKA